MLKNKSLCIYFLGIILCTVLSIICILNNNQDYAIVIVVIFAVITVIFTYFRYREISKLADYLAKIQNMIDYSALEEINNLLSLNDYKEGELSILKTEVFKATKKLVEQREKLVKDKKFLSDSLADISHQLKTPLTSLVVLSDLLESEELPQEKRHEFVSNMQVQLNRIDWLLSTLLKMSKIDAGTIKLKPTKVNIYELIEKSFNHLLIPMELKNQDFIIKGDKEAFCYCDFNWTVEAIANIGKNCIEHTPSGGGITVSFEENVIYSIIKIKDNGVGIDKEDLPNIFNRFYKGKNSSKDSVGIGLAFTKQIVSMQNGSILVTSGESGGTEFEIRFYKL